MKRKLLLASFLFIAIQLVYGQGRVVSGKVTAEDGSSVPGVNVLVKGTSTGAITDLDGNYRINVTDDAVLVFSFIGFETQEVAVGSRSIIDVSLAESLQQLSEVIVVGYGTSRKEQLTGSIAVVEADKIAQIPTPTFQEALQGSTPGLQVVAQDGAPGAGVAIRVRGIGSINASNDPLYVIDGIPITAAADGISTSDFDNDGRSANPLAALSSNDIESIVVLKDAASTAIYGSRGANGVVLITTKSGKKGQAKVDINTRIGFSDFAFNNLLEPINEAQYRQLYVEGKVNAGDFATEAEALDLYEQQFPEAFAGEADTDWLEEMTQIGVTQQYDVSVSGGTDNLTYYVSGGYFGQEGTVVNNKFERYSTRINLTVRATDKLTISNNLSLSYFDQRGITDGTRWQAPFYLAYLMSPAVPVFDDQGRYYGDHASFYMGGNNPVGHLHDDKREREQSRIIDNFSVAYEVIDGLTVKSAWSFDILNIDDFIYGNPRYGDQRNVGGQSQEATVDQLNWLGTQTVNYSTTLADMHNLDVLVGYEAQKITTDQVDVVREGLPHPTITGVSAGANPDPPSFTSRSESSFSSYFSRINYDYNQKYFASFSVRADGSSRFGPDERWGTFWSVGGGYAISEESFMQGVAVVDYLKLRISYGVTGNASLDDDNVDTDNNYIWAQAYGFNNIAYDGVPGGIPQLIGNRLLTWESQENFNVAVDFTGFNRRLNGTIEYFVRTSSDLILNRPLSRTTGFESQPSNIGDMENRGWEISANGDVLEISDFTLNIGGNITFIENEITRLDEPIVDGTKRREEGRDFQEYYLYGWAGVDPADGSKLWYTDETKTEVTKDRSDAERFYDGKSATPDFFGAFNLVASWRAFTLSTQFNYQFGNYVYDSPGWVIHGDGRFTPRSTSKWAFENRWTTPGQEALFPQHKWGNRDGVSTQQNQDRYLFEGDYIRMRTLSLSYDLPTSLIGRAKVRNARVSILLNNYFTWVKDDDLHFDPEQTINGNYNTVTPINKTITFALNVGI